MNTKIICRTYRGSHRIASIHQMHLRFQANEIYEVVNDQDLCDFQHEAIFKLFTSREPIKRATKICGTKKYGAN